MMFNAVLFFRLWISSNVILDIYRLPLNVHPFLLQLRPPQIGLAVTTDEHHTDTWFFLSGSPKWKYLWDRYVFRSWFTFATTYQIHIKFETLRRSLHRLKLPADVRIEAQPKLHPLHPLHLLDLALYLYLYPYPSLVFTLALAHPVAADALQRVQIGSSWLT